VCFLNGSGNGGAKGGLAGAAASPNAAKKKFPLFFVANIIREVVLQQAILIPLFFAAHIIG